MNVPVLPVTVIIPVFNREHTLGATLRSVEQQGRYRVAKTLVIDDNSSDGSVALAESLGYEVVRLPENQGAAAARNMGIRLVKTPWVSFLDSDDRWRPNLLATPLALYRFPCPGLRRGLPPGWRKPGISDGGGAARTDAPWPPGHHRSGESVITSSTLVRADIVSRLGGFDTRWKYSEDFDLWLRVLEHGPGWCDATPTVDYERGGTSKSEHGSRVDDARVRIVYSFAGRPWWRKRSAERLVGVIYWEAIRSALRSHRWAAAVHYGSKVLWSRDRVTGAGACILRRRRLRTRLKALTSAGQPERRAGA